MKTLPTLSTLNVNKETLSTLQYMSTINYMSTMFMYMSTRKEVKEVHIQLSQDKLQIQFLYEEDRLKEFVQIKSTLFFGSSLKPFIY